MFNYRLLRIWGGNFAMEGGSRPAPVGAFAQPERNHSMQNPLINILL